MAKRTHRNRVAREAAISSQTRTPRRADPIAMGRISRSPLGVLDKPALGVSRSVENRQDVLKARQARLAQIADELTRQGRALHDAAHRKATAPQEQKSRPNQVRVSDMGSLRNPPKAATQKVKEHDNRSSPEKVRDYPTCKERPKHNRGNGSSRTFVPWCRSK
jgi:hypothetical protein